jgi:uncharacterized membrane protein YraQ (UPF0718 family)
MEHFNALIENFISLSAEASPWLLLGLLIAGLMKAWVPTKILNKHLGGGSKSIIKAALIGAPLPLCSCGVIPVATELKRSGASSPATSAFLVATPETGVDSVSVSYAMLGPIFAIYRPITAILSAIFTGLLVAIFQKKEKRTDNNNSSTVPTHDHTVKKSGCCASKGSQKTVSEEARVDPLPPKKPSSCCDSDKPTNIISNGPVVKTLQGVKYAATQLIDDLILWLLVGLIFATLVLTFLPEEFLLSYGSGLTAMMMMIVISIPMYICATASTPIAAGFILAGLSPGTALVFMMAGPATNISTLGVIKKEMGGRVLGCYLMGITLSSIAFGSLLDFGLNFYAIDITQQMQHSHSLLPHWFGIFCTVLITILSIKPLRKLIIK